MRPQPVAVGGPQPDDSCALQEHCEAYYDMRLVDFLALTEPTAAAPTFAPKLNPSISKSKSKIKPAALQVELHPYLTQEKLQRLCRQHGITLIGFSSFGSASYVELGMAEKNESLLEDKRIKQLAAKYSRSPAQVVLRWAVQRGTGVIPKSQKASRMKENLSIFDFQLSDEDLNAISLLNKNKRYNDPGNFCEAAFNTFHPIYD